MSMVTDSWDEDAQDWRPDDWDVKAYVVIDYRDRMASSVAGPVPSFGTQEWAKADPQTQAASYARHERDVAAAQGPAISNRMAAEAARRQAHREAVQDMSKEWTRGRYANQILPTATREQRVADKAYREQQPKPWEDGYAASIPRQRAASDTSRAVAQAINACQVHARADQPTQTRTADDAEGDSWAR